METKPNQPPNRLRLNKILAQHGLCSRRKADDWIHDGRVALDGMICREVGKLVDPTTQQVSVDGRPLDHKPPLVYIALNKPRGAVSTCSDPQGRKTVLDLIDEETRSAGLFPVGRLDSDSEGLILMTNDGEWNQILLHPSHQVWKVYRVTTDRDLTPNIKKRLERGVEIDGKRTHPARITMKGKSGLRNNFDISIREGRNRQIRRMLARCRLTALTLKRTEIGPISLGKLDTGEWRYLNKNEIQSIQKLSERIKNGASPT